MRRKASSPMADIVPFRAGGRPRQSLIGRWAAAILRALHEARQREGARQVRRYRHLICISEDHPELELLRRKCRI